jgi:hypothetical protein
MYKGFPGGCGTPRLDPVATYSPQSQKLIDGASMYV